MEHRKHEYKVVMEDGADWIVLGDLSDLDIAAAAYMAAMAKNPKRNLQLRQGAHIKKRHDGEPKPETPPDPRLPSWDVSLIRGSRMEFKGSVAAEDEDGATKVAIERFGLNPAQAKRLVVKPTRR